MADKSIKYYFSISWIIILLISSSHIIGQTEDIGNIKLEEKPVYTSLSKALRNADKVYRLNLSNKDLQEFPIEILKLKELRVLILDSNKITSIPQQIHKLENLQYLSLGHNFISEVPDSIGCLANLRFLYLENNKLSYLPSAFYKLNKLEELFINNNSLTELSKDIQIFQKLERLIASNNQFETIPDEIGHLYALKKLSFSKNKIKILPEHFYELTSLVLLYLDHNNIYKIDHNIKKLSKLEGLGLDYNNLRSLPVELGELYNLKHLYLDHNELSTLPNQLGNIFDLQNLFIGNNPIKEIPASFNNLVKLKVFDMNEILIKPFPQVLYDIQNNGTKIQGLTTKELYQTKIILSQARNKKIIDHSEEAISLYDKLIKIDTNNIVAMTEYANLLLEFGDFDKAASISKLALSKNISQKNIDDLRTIYSNSINRTNKTELTIKTLTEKVKVDSTNASPIFELGKFYFDQQKYDEAKVIFCQAIKVDPLHANSHFYLALISLSLKNDSLFILSALRYFILHPEGNKTSTMLPFLLSKMKMKSGIAHRNGQTTYHDTYIIRDDNGDVIYKSESPTADLLYVMLFDLTRDNLLKKKDQKTTKELQPIIEDAFYSTKNNFEIFQSELKLISKSSINNKQKDKELWDYYLPYYRSLIDNGHLEAFAYMITKIRNDDDTTSWLNNNANKLEEFNQWNKSYLWGK